jgi:hypothetical protein
MSTQRWCVCTHAESEHTAGFCGGSNGYRAGVYCSCTQFHDERTIMIPARPQQPAPGTEGE